MARSVGVHPRSVATVFVCVENPRLGWDDSQYVWDDFIDSVRYVLSKRFESLGDADGWEGREGQVVLDNGHAKVVVYSYGDVSSICLVPKDQPLGLAWAKRAAPAFHEALEASGFDVLRRIGVFSNGEAVYETRRKA